MNKEDLADHSPFGKSCSCIEMLQSVIDGEATEAQILYFRQHMEGCTPCSKNYQLDTTLQTLIRSKCCGGHPPEDLADQIKSQIRKLS